jgi:PAS domain-containing protein
VEKRNLINRSFIRFVAPDSRKKFFKLVKLVRSKGAKQKLELKLLKNKKPIDVLIEINLGSYNTEIFNSLLITIIDISQRKNSEEALTESEKKYRAVFNNANDAIFMHPVNEGMPGFI